MSQSVLLGLVELHEVELAVPSALGQSAWAC